MLLPQEHLHLPVFHVASHTFCFVFCLPPSPLSLLSHLLRSLGMAGVAVPQWDLAVFDQFKQAVMAVQGCTEEEAVVALGEMWGAAMLAQQGAGGGPPPPPDPPQGPSTPQDDPGPPVA
jgi:hypothetical protein